MSVVTGIMVICDLCEDDSGEGTPPILFDRLNEWISSRKPGQSLLLLDDHFGGGKHPQWYSAGAGINHFPEDDFAAFFMDLPWEEPFNALLIMQPEYGATRIFRPGEAL